MSPLEDVAWVATMDVAPRYRNYFRKEIIVDLLVYKTEILPLPLVRGTLDCRRHVRNQWNAIVWPASGEAVHDSCGILECIVLLPVTLPELQHVKNSL